jgi:hypothetical protein
MPCFLKVPSAKTLAKSVYNTTVIGTSPLGVYTFKSVVEFPGVFILFELAVDFPTCVKCRKKYISDCFFGL